MLFARLLDDLTNLCWGGGAVLTYQALFPLPWTANEPRSIFTEEIGSVVGTVGSRSEAGLHRKASLEGGLYSLALSGLSSHSHVHAACVIV